MSSEDPLVSLRRRLLELRGPCLVVTGAGTSFASGIPTFRGPDPEAVWSTDLMKMATRAYFESDPVGSWRWYLRRFRAALAARPNAAHRALVELERWHEGHNRTFLLVTQNIDTLHEAAGSRALVKVHGSADRVRCSRLGCALGAPTGSIRLADVSIDVERIERALHGRAPAAECLPSCQRCGAVLRPHVLWFDELYSEHEDYQFERVIEAAESAELALFVGTSFSVGVTDAVLRRVLGRERPVFSIDPAGRAPEAPITWLREPAEEALPGLVGELTRS